MTNPKRQETYWDTLNRLAQLLKDDLGRNLGRGRNLGKVIEELKNTVEDLEKEQLAGGDPYGDIRALMREAQLARETR